MESKTSDSPGDSMQWTVNPLRGAFPLGKAKPEKGNKIAGDVGVGDRSGGENTARGEERRPETGEDHISLSLYNLNTSISKHTGPPPLPQRRGTHAGKGISRGDLEAMRGGDMARDLHRKRIELYNAAVRDPKAVTATPSNPLVNPTESRPKSPDSPSFSVDIDAISPKKPVDSVNPGHSGGLPVPTGRNGVHPRVEDAVNPLGGKSGVVEDKKGKRSILSKLLSSDDQGDSTSKPSVLPIGHPHIQIPGNNTSELLRPIPPPTIEILPARSRSSTGSSSSISIHSSVSNNFGGSGSGAGGYGSVNNASYGAGGRRGAGMSNNNPLSQRMYGSSSPGGSMSSSSGPQSPHGYSNPYSIHSSKFLLPGERERHGERERERGERERKRVSRMHKKAMKSWKKDECLTIPEQIVLMRLQKDGSYEHNRPMKMALVAGILMQLVMLGKITILPHYRGDRRKLQVLAVPETIDTGDELLEEAYVCIRQHPKQRGLLAWIEDFAGLDMRSPSKIQHLRRRLAESLVVKRVLRAIPKRSKALGVFGSVRVQYSLSAGYGEQQRDLLIQQLYSLLLAHELHLRNNLFVSNQFVVTLGILHAAKLITPGLIPEEYAAEALNYAEEVLRGEEISLISDDIPFAERVVLVLQNIMGLLEQNIV